MDFCLMLKVGENISKTINKNLAVNIAKSLLIMQNNQSQMHLKLLQKDQFKKATGDLIGKKIVDKSIKNFTTE